MNQFFATAKSYFLQNRYMILLHVSAVSLISIYCAGYFTSGDRIEWGDFSFFVQGYEAIRISVLEFGQFPWWNPWVVGGSPLYANPQFGVFSLQTLSVFAFGAPVGLKIALFIYTLMGYFSMFALLRLHFKGPLLASTLLSLCWVFCSFFVAHLPSHFTFAWYMLAPLFIMLSLRMTTIKQGAIFGCIMGIMGLAQIHNPFFHIGIICAFILLIRIGLAYKSNWKNIVYSSLTAAGVFFVLAGHRVLLTIQNAGDFPRLLSDDAAHPAKSVLAILLPYSVAHPLPFIKYPSVPFNWTEITAYVGIGIYIALLLIAFWIGWFFYSKKKPSNLKPLYIIFGFIVLFFAIGLGDLGPLSPYAILNHLPILNNMRVSSRWFIFMIICIFIFIVFALKERRIGDYLKFTINGLLVLGTIELFALNAGYHGVALNRDIITAQKMTAAYAFQQSSHFGETLQFPEGIRIPRNDGNLPHFYREYEATTFNIGVIQANDALIDTNTIATPRCGIEKNCSYLLTDNAKVTYWSPNKVVLTRTANGPIKINANNSEYFLINGKRQSRELKVAEPRQDFVIYDESEVITIEVSPDITPETLIDSIRRAGKNSD